MQRLPPPHTHSHRGTHTRDPPEQKSLLCCRGVTGGQTKILPAPAKWFTESYMKLWVLCLSGCSSKAMRKYWQLRAWSPWIILCLSPAINKRSSLCTSLSSADNRAPPPPFLKVHSNNSKIIYEHCSARTCPLAQPVGDTLRHCRLPHALLPKSSLYLKCFPLDTWEGKGSCHWGPSSSNTYCMEGRRGCCWRKINFEDKLMA